MDFFSLYLHFSRKDVILSEMQLFDLQPFCKKRICVALSGGADSVCLLDSFRRGAAEYEIKLFAVHVEHGIRGEESLRDLKFCENLCKRWNVDLIVEKRDVPALSKRDGIGLEEAARKARYEIFEKLLSLHEADLVATAHHADDVAETVLFRLARGTSPAGMNAITDFCGIVRPLISVSRAQILSYLSENGLEYVEDSTNSDERYTRNYIRHTVLPAFSKIHGNAVEHLTRFAAQCARDDAYLTQLAREKITFRGNDRLVPADLPEPLFLRACLWCLNAEKDYTSASLNEVTKLKMLQSGKKVCLPCGQIAVREYENIVFYEPAPPVGERPFCKEEFLSFGEDKLRADLDAFPQGCVVRTRREGDFIVPFGGHKKSLKKFFTDKKISSRLGKEILLVACGSEILVAIGVEISDKVKVTESTTRVGFF